MKNGTYRRGHCRSTGPTSTSSRSLRGVCLLGLAYPRLKSICGRPRPVNSKSSCRSFGTAIGWLKNEEYMQNFVALRMCLSRRTPHLVQLGGSPSSELKTHRAEHPFINPESLYITAELRSNSLKAAGNPSEMASGTPKVYRGMPSGSVVQLIRSQSPRLLLKSLLPS
jgi:hypothetical protein